MENNGNSIGTKTNFETKKPKNLASDVKPSLTGNKVRQTNSAQEPKTRQEINAFKEQSKLASFQQPKASTSTPNPNRGKTDSPLSSGYEDKLKKTMGISSFEDNSKKRVTEVNNSYFECKTVNFDSKQLRERLEEIDNEIQKTDFEISKLNSIEFDIDL